MSFIKITLSLAFAVALSGCAAVGTHSSYADGKAKGSWFTSAKSNPVKAGKKNFRSNNYGLAERNFRQAVEASPRNAEAWLGLAASYDQLGRFDLADRAYDEVIRIKGPLPQILNNRGYSYFLRGDKAKARSILTRAAQSDPQNRQILGNLELLDSENSQT